MLIFSLSLPMTRLAVQELEPWFLSFGRMALAALVAIPFLLVARRRPRRNEVVPLLLIGLGVVVGFPLLMAFAMRLVDSSHGAIVMTVLPFATAVAGTLLGGDRPRPRFWLWAALGAGIVGAYVLAGVEGGAGTGDLLMLLASAAAAMGYAIGARLTGRMPGLVVIGWALVLLLPLTGPLALWTAPTHPETIGVTIWLAFVYVAVLSQFLGFFFWYKGLAMGGIARVSQIQLLQTFLTLGFSALLLGEHVGPAAFLVAALTVLCIWMARRSA